MPRTLSCLFLAAMPLILGACQLTPEQRAARIDPRPSREVRFALDRISPAVVRIDVVTELFDNGAKRSQRSLGSGVIIDPLGHVLTNFHVAGRAKRLQVTLYNQEHVKGTLIGSDHWTDLALVQLDMDEVKQKQTSFSYAPLGDSDQVVLGEPVLAIGTPYGLTRTVTAGIVSNPNRFTEESSIDGYETGWFNNWIQTDAAINPGNSGGPLVNMRGEVIGINSKGLLAGNNLGFAIPADTAKEVIRDILDHHKVNRSYVGIDLQPLQDLNNYYDVSTDKGVLIPSVDKDSPASHAGVQAEDILLAINGTPVVARFPEQIARVRKMIAGQPIGSELHLTLQRGGKKMTVVNTTMVTEKLESVVTEESVVAELGITVRPVTRSYLREHQLAPVKGVLVTSIRAGSAAEEAKMFDDDIIIRVNNKPVTGVDDLEELLKNFDKNGKTIRVDVQRDRSVVLLAVKPRG